MDSAPVAGWLFGVELWRGWRRAQPTIIVFAHPLLLGVLALSVLEPGSGSARQIAESLVVGAGAVMFVLTLTIIIVNRPRFAVPPTLRREPGLLSQ